MRLPPYRSGLGALGLYDLERFTDPAAKFPAGKIDFHLSQKMPMVAIDRQPANRGSSDVSGYRGGY